MAIHGSGKPPEKSVRGEARALLALAGPLVANNFALAGMALSDTVMAGRFSAADLAAIGVGNGIWVIGWLFGLGVLMAMSPVVAHCFAAGGRDEVGRFVRQGIWLSQVLALLVAAFLWSGEALISAAGVEPSLVPLSAEYLRALSFGLPGAYAYLTLRFASEGIGHTRPIMYMALTGLVVNIAGNYVLMYGKLGLPAMGAVGCGYATSLTLWSMFFALALYSSRARRYRPLAIFRAMERPSWAVQKELLGVGLPIGLSVVAEVGLFGGVALMMGRFGAAAAGAHQIASSYTNTLFMLPLALHSALIIRVGQAAGRGDLAAVRHAGKVGISLCGGVMVVAAIVTLLVRLPVVAIYTVDPEVRQVAVALLAVAALYQVWDGLAIGAAGALRGLKDTQMPMVLSFVAYWLVGFPVAFGMGVMAGGGPPWVWGGLVAGLMVAAVLLNLRFLRVTRPAAGARPRAVRSGGTDDAASSGPSADGPVAHRPD